MTDSRPLALDDDITGAIGTAFDTGNFITVAYVDADGWAHVSRRGSTQVLDDQTVALWARKPDDGLAAAITDRPHVTLFYIDLAERGVLYTLYGDARRAEDPDITERVWNAMPEPERAQDPERRGVAIVIDLQRVVAQGMRPENNFTMER